MSYAVPVRHPNFNNLSQVKLQQNSEFEKELQKMFAWSKLQSAGAGKGDKTPMGGPTLPTTVDAMNGTLPQVLDKGTTGTGKNMKLGPMASSMAQGGLPLAQPQQQMVQPTRVANIFTQPQAPQPAPQQAPAPQAPQAQAPQAPQFMNPIMRVLGAPPSM